VEAKTETKVDSAKKTPEAPKSTQVVVSAKKR